MWGATSLLALSGVAGCSIAAASCAHSKRWRAVRAGTGQFAWLLRAVDATRLLTTNQFYPVAADEFRRDLVRRFPFEVFMLEIISAARLMCLVCRYENPATLACRMRGNCRGRDSGFGRFCLLGAQTDPI